MNTAQAREIPEMDTAQLPEKFLVCGKDSPEVRFFRVLIRFYEKKNSENKSEVKELPYTFFQNSYVGSTSPPRTTTRNPEEKRP